MSFRVAFNEKTGIITVKIYGAASKREHLTARDKALRLCKSKQCSKVLVDLRKLTTMSLSTMGCFEFGKFVAQTVPIVQIAHVLPDDIASQKDVIFTSMVESNRGKITREFGSLKKARHWLIS